MATRNSGESRSRAREKKPVDGLQSPISRIPSARNCVYDCCDCTIVMSGLSTSNDSNATLPSASTTKVSATRSVWRWRSDRSSDRLRERSRRSRQRCLQMRESIIAHGCFVKLAAFQRVDAIVVGAQLLRRREDGRHFARIAALSTRTEASAQMSTESFTQHADPISLCCPSELTLTTQRP